MQEHFAGRYADPEFSALERAAIAWLDGFYQLEHLLATRRWVGVLQPVAGPALRFAALVHDAERHFPGGPTSTPTNGFDDPDYLFAHSLRSAGLVEDWLHKQRPLPDASFITAVRKLILRHEIGGNTDEDLLQAADSLSFLETLDWLCVDWVRKGRYSGAGATAKLNWMVERIRPPAALAASLPLYAAAIHRLQAADDGALDLGLRRKLAGDGALLTGSAPAMAGLL